MQAQAKHLGNEFAERDIPSATLDYCIVSKVAHITFEGEWILRNNRTPVSQVIDKIKNEDINGVVVNAKDVNLYDSAFICSLMRIYEFCSKNNLQINLDSVQEGAKELLTLAVAVPESDASQKRVEEQKALFDAVGHRAIGYVNTVKSVSEFVGENTISSILAILGKARFRTKDLLMLIQRAGPEALPIVALISFLVGLILAFVGAIQLAKYGSEIFVADLVGIAMVREMGAIMVGIVMSGRTGAAFAAELGSMKVNEEISAYRTFGISPMEFLVFPRVLSLVLMFPLLTIFADVIGMLGGLAIGVGMFDISYEQYTNRSIAVLNIIQLSTGIGKSIIFGLIVGIIGCRQGLNCENSSIGVGQATTSAVVQSITWIIVADAIFAVIFTIFDI